MIFVEMFINNYNTNITYCYNYYSTPSAPVHMYEMVDISSQKEDKTSHESHGKHSQLLAPISHTDSKQEQAQEYQVPIKGHGTAKSDEIINVRHGLQLQVDAHVMKSSEEENTYQPLIPPRSIIGNESREYQSLTLPKELNVAPSLPPKLGTNRAVKRAQSNVQCGWKDNYY